MMKNNPIRKSYESLGVEQFYRQEGDHYANPHEAQVVALLQQNNHHIDYKKVLDFCCGSGEVTVALANMGFGDTVGSDPFTQAAYQKRTGKTASDWNFEYVIRNGFQDTYSAVICSFAMHLCPEAQLFPLVMQIFQSTRQLVIITPHKRPALEQLDGVELAFVSDVLTERGKKIRLKSYRRAW